MKKAISIFLSLLLLVSSSGVAYAQHYCGGMEMLSKITIADIDLSCGMEEMTSDCEHDVADEDHCCENLITQVSTDDNYAKACFDIEFDNSFFTSIVSVFVLQEVTITSNKNISFADYSPPPLIQNLCILYDSFLI